MPRNWSFSIIKSLDFGHEGESLLRPFSSHHYWEANVLGPCSWKQFRMSEPDKTSKAELTWWIIQWSCPGKICPDFMDIILIQLPAKEKMIAKCLIFLLVWFFLSLYPGAFPFSIDMLTAKEWFTAGKGCVIVPTSAKEKTCPRTSGALALILEWPAQPPDIILLQCAPLKWSSCCAAGYCLIITHLTKQGAYCQQHPKRVAAAPCCKVPENRPIILNEEVSSCRSGAGVKERALLN